jgi:hypothetical protein
MNTRCHKWSHLSCTYRTVRICHLAFCYRNSNKIPYILFHILHNFVDWSDQSILQTSKCNNLKYVVVTKLRFTLRERTKDTIARKDALNLMSSSKWITVLWGTHWTVASSMGNKHQAPLPADCTAAFEVLAPLHRTWCTWQEVGTDLPHHWEWNRQVTGPAAGVLTGSGCFPETQSAPGTGRETEAPEAGWMAAGWHRPALPADVSVVLVVAAAHPGAAVAVVIVAVELSSAEEDVWRRYIKKLATGVAQSV